MNEEILAAGPSSSQPTLLFRQQTTASIAQSSSPLAPSASTSSIRYQIIPQTPPMSRLTGDRLITTSSSNNTSTSAATNSTNQPQQQQQQQSNLQQQTSGNSNNSHSLSTVLNTVVNNDGGDLSSEQDRKRIKLENEFSSSNDLVALKRRILEHKYMRLKSVKEKYSEHVAELFFLQTNMNMMEYPTWRKKPQTPEFMNFVRAHRLDQSPLDDLAVSLTYSLVSHILTDPPHFFLHTQLSSQSQANLALGTEVKIPGVGATPVAVSTRLPAAVAQLCHQGMSFHYFIRFFFT